MSQFIFLLVGAIIGLFGQWAFYRYTKRDQRSQGPAIVVSRIIQGPHLFVELRNIGVDTLSEMDVKMSWLIQGEHRELIAKDFFRTSEVKPSQIEIIGPGETLRVGASPIMTDDGLVDVQVSGLGVTSQRLYSVVGQIEVALPKPTNGQAST